MHSIISALLATGWLVVCQPSTRQSGQATADTSCTIQLVVTTDLVKRDYDDPASWVNPQRSAQSLVLGTDKDPDGRLFVYGLNGHRLADQTSHGLKQPNDVDVDYGLLLNGKPTDIAVVIERETHKLRVIVLPNLMPIDGGGLPTVKGETGPGFRDLMGVVLCHTPNGVRLL